MMKQRRIISVLLLAIGTGCGMYFLTPRASAREDAPPQASQSAAHKPTGSTPLALGVGTHFAQHKGILAVNLNLVRDANVGWIRDGAPWSAIERAKGVLKMPVAYDTYIQQAHEHGLRQLLCLNYGNKLYDPGVYPVSQTQKEAFSRYCEFIVKRYKGKINLYEIWNEWSGLPHPRIPGRATPQAYAALLAYVAPRLKKIAPSIKIIGGWRDNPFGKYQWLDVFMAAGGLKHIDGYSMHAYMYKYQGVRRTPEAWVQRMQALERRLTAHHQGRPMPIYVTEVGWPTYDAGNGTSYAMEAAYLARLYLLAPTLPFIKGVWWYDFQDDGWRSKRGPENFGVVRPDGTPKPAWFALRDVAGLLRESTFLGRVDVGDPLVWVLRFDRSDGRQAWALWSAHEGSDTQIILKSPSKTPTQVTIQKVGTEQSIQRPWIIRHWAAQDGLHLLAKTIKGQLSLTVGQMPWIITGDLDDATVQSVKQWKQSGGMGPGGADARLPETIGFVKPIADNRQFGDSPHRLAHWKWNRLTAKGKRSSPADIDGWFVPRYDAGHLYLTVSIRDDIHKQNNDISQMWRGDSIQIATQRLGGADTPVPTGFSEITVALTPQGTKTYREASQNGQPTGLASDVKSDIHRRNGYTVYDITLPVQAMGLKALKPGTIIGFSILANDNDTGRRKGYLHWGDGIGQGKNPRQYGWLIMQP